MWKVTDVEWCSVPLFNTDNNTCIPYSSIELEENKNRHLLRGPHAHRSPQTMTQKVYIFQCFSPLGKVCNYTSLTFLKS